MFPETTNEAIQASIEQATAEFDVDIVDVEFKDRPSGLVLTVIVDADEALDIDVLTDLSEAISEALDVSQLLDGHPYELEVTSPGVDRPLAHSRQWIRNRSRRVEVLMGGQVLVGRIGPLVHDESGIADTVVLIIPPQRLKGQAISAKSLEIYKVRLADIESAVVQVEFKTPRGADVDAALDDEIVERAQWLSPESISTKVNK